MFNVAISNFICNTASSAVTAAGLAGIFEYEQPKAAAVATAVGFTCHAVVEHIAKQAFDQNAAWLCGLAVGIYAGGIAGRQYNPNFSYGNMAGARFVVTFGSSLAASILGINPELK